MATDKASREVLPLSESESEWMLEVVGSGRTTLRIRAAMSSNFFMKSSATHKVSGNTATHKNER